MLPERRTGVPRRFLLAGAAVFVVIAGGAVGGIVWATSGGSGSKPATTAVVTHPARLSHRQYALLYTDAVIHKTRISVLAHWPSPPYQHYIYSDQTCYEWWDKPIALYNLCFKNGVLTTKAIE
jgi:hypothetical protein